MRIIAGVWKGRRLARLPNGIRPTSDRLREAIFSHLGDRVQDSVWLDPFAGSGAIGLEALSRGARFVYFNEPHRAAQRLLQQNLEICRPEQSYAFSHKDAFLFLRQSRPRKSDFIYLDPPYHDGLEGRLLETIESVPEFAESLILLEHFKKVQLTPGRNWICLRTLKAGDSWVEALRLCSEPA